jgi:hypothetical protein
MTRPHVSDGSKTLVGRRNLLAHGAVATGLAGRHIRKEGGSGNPMAHAHAPMMISSSLLCLFIVLSFFCPRKFYRASELRV